jgi:hypothetical protein
MAPQIVLPSLTHAALQRLKQALRDRRRRRARLEKEHALALLERGRAARRRAANKVAR